MEERRPFIATYIQASRPFGVLYIGVTSNLFERSRQHREGVVEGFTKAHGCGLLVWFEPHELMTEAIRREKQLKRWNRPWKMELVERRNPDWLDLYPWFCGIAADPRVGEDDDGGVAAFLAGLTGDD